MSDSRAGHAYIKSIPILDFFSCIPDREVRIFHVFAWDSNSYITHVISSGLKILSYAKHVKSLSKGEIRISIPCKIIGNPYLGEIRISISCKIIDNPYLLGEKCLCHVCG